jgi:hypothetical protein
MPSSSAVGSFVFPNAGYNFLGCLITKKKEKKKEHTTGVTSN